MPGTRLIGWPFFGILHLRLAVRRSRSKEPILQRVGEGWYIGGWPPSKEIIPEGPLSIIDCTNEYQRTVERPYICLPTWDTQGATRSLNCCHHQCTSNVSTTENMHLRFPMNTRDVTAQSSTYLCPADLTADRP